MDARSRRAPAERDGRAGEDLPAADEIEHVARELARLSTSEIAAALHAARAPAVAQRAIAVLAWRPSARLGRVLSRFDADIASIGLARAALEMLRALGATVASHGACPTSGPVLVVANHPGAYDALAIMAATGRDDVAFIAADRAFLRAMPRLRRHLVLVADDGALARARGARRALDVLEAGGAVVQLGAGAIEPDPRFAPRGADVLGRWADGTGMLAGRAVRAGAPVVPCLVSGVHSARAKRLPFVRWAERRGITTIAPLVQATTPGFRDVAVSVRFGAPIDPARLLGGEGARARTEIVRVAVSALVDAER